MLTDKDLQDIARSAAGGHLASAATVLELVEEITRRRQAFADAERTDLDDLLTTKQRDELLQSMRDVMLAKFGPLAVGSPSVGDWRRVVEETAREAAHRIVNMEVRRPPCEHDELMYVCELERLRKRIAELEGHQAGGDPPLARALNDALVRMDHMARSRSILSAGEVATTLEWIRKTSLLLPGAS